MSNFQVNKSSAAPATAKFVSPALLERLQTQVSELRNEIRELKGKKEKLEETLQIGLLDEEGVAKAEGRIAALHFLATAAETEAARIQRVLESA